MIKSDRLLDVLLELVRIESPSREEAAIGKHLAERFATMGLNTEIDEIGNVIARLDGQGDAFMLAAHMDTVTPCQGVEPIVEDGIVRSDGTTVLGGDDKAGVAIILEVLQVILTNDLGHLPIEVVITVQEEIGLRGAKALDTQRLQSRLGISLDAGGAPGSIIVSAPSQNSLSVVVHGKAAHAGACPEEGVSAIVIAAEAISQMPLGRIDEETTANIGLIHGGRATNIIPDKVELKGETRSRSEDKLSSQTSAMLDALHGSALKHGGTLDIDVVRAYTGYDLTENDEIVHLIMKNMRSLDLEPVLVATGGGSDANVFNAAGIQIVNIGVGMAQVHTMEEYIALSDMVSTAEVVLACLLDTGE